MIISTSFAKRLILVAYKKVFSIVQFLSQKGEFKVRKRRCSKALYCSFLASTSFRFSCKAMSEVCFKTMSHDTVSRWIKNVTIKPNEVYKASNTCFKEAFDSNSYVVIACDDTVIDKSRSKKIVPAKSNYSGNKHGVTTGIPVVNLVIVQENERCPVIPLDLRVYADGKSKNVHFREMMRGTKKGALKVQ